MVTGYIEKMKRILAIFALLCVPVLLQAQRDEAAARQIFADLNQERTAQHLPQLHWDNALARAAQFHTEQMVRQNELSHELPGEPQLGQRIADAGARVSAFGENVGFAESPEAVHQGWMHSSGHRANILSTGYDVVGIAAFRVGDRVFATQDFGKLTQAISADEADLKIRDAIADAREKAHLPKLSLKVLSGSHCSASAFADATSVFGRYRTIVDYTTADPSSLPAPLLERLADSHYQSYSISVCDHHDPAGFTMLEAHIALFY